MTTIALTSPRATASPFKRLIRAHPLVAYFLLAFAATWVFWLPIALSREVNGLGLLPFHFPDVVVYLCLALGGFVGVPVAAFTVMAITSGRAGVRHLLQRCGQWRVGIQWYLIVLCGFIGVFLVGFSVVYGVNLPRALLAQPTLIFTVFFAALAFSLLTGNLQEEVGWRGFALPRLQQRYGPVLGSVILGVLHSCWHLPVLFTRLLGPTNLTDFAGFLVVGLTTTLIYTWLFNHTRGSVLLAALTHGCSNAALGLAATLIPAHVVVSGWAQPLVNGGWKGDILFGVGICALLLLVFTRGRLGYQVEQNAQIIATAEPTTPLQPLARR